MSNFEEVKEILFGHSPEDVIEYDHSTYETSETDNHPMEGPIVFTDVSTSLDVQFDHEPTLNLQQNRGPVMTSNTISLTDAPMESNVQSGNMPYSSDLDHELSIAIPDDTIISTDISEHGLNIFSYQASGPAFEQQSKEAAMTPLSPPSTFMDMIRNVIHMDSNAKDMEEYAYAGFQFDPNQYISESLTATSTSLQPRDSTTSSVKSRKRKIKDVSNQSGLVALTEQQLKNLHDTTDIFKDRIGFILKFVKKDSSFLQARIIGMEINTKTPRSPMVFFVEYPLDSSIIWHGLSSSSKQAYLDSATLSGKLISYRNGQWILTGSPKHWQYTSTDGIETNLNLVFTKEVRTGKVSVRDLYSSEEEMNNMLPPIDKDYIPPPWTDYRVALIREVDYLIKAFPDREEEIDEIMSTEVGVQRNQIAKPVKQKVSHTKSASNIESSVVNDTTTTKRQKNNRSQYIFPPPTKTTTSNVTTSNVTVYSSENPFVWHPSMKTDEYPTHVITYDPDGQTREHLTSERRCAVCSKEFHTLMQDIFLLSEKTISIKLKGFACPYYSHEHQYCIECLFKHVEQSILNGQFIIYCPGTFTDITSIWENGQEIRCDNGVRECSFYFNDCYIRRILSLIPKYSVRWKLAYTDQTCLLEQYEYNARMYIISLMEKKFPRYYILQCPKQCGYVNVVDRIKFPVDVKFQCSTCNIHYCTGCQGIISHEEEEDNHNSCTRYFHYRQMQKQEIKELLPDLSTFTALSNDKFWGIVEFLNRTYFLSCHSQCPNCGDFINLRKRVKKWDVEDIIISHITMCSCRIDWCYICSGFLPRDERELDAFKMFKNRIAHYENDGSFNRCRHNDRVDIKNDANKCCPLYFRDAIIGRDNLTDSEGLKLFHLERGCLPLLGVGIYDLVSRLQRNIRSRVLSTCNKGVRKIYKYEEGNRKKRGRSTKK